MVSHLTPGPHKTQVLLVKSFHSRFLKEKQYPSYIVAKQQYQGSRAAYEMALQHGDQEGYEAWNEKVKKEALDNMGPNGPNFNVLVGPN